MHEPLRIYIDENIAPQFLKALNLIEEHLNTGEKKAISVLSIQQEFGVGVKDEEWIPEVGKQKGIAISLNRRIQSSRAQGELY